MKKIALLGMGIMLLSGAAMAQSNPDMPKIVNKQLIVNGKPFLVKGMVYSPEPVGMPGNSLPGQSPDNWPYTKGAWICYKVNWWDQNDTNTSACFDSDLFSKLTVNTPQNQAYNAKIPSKWEADLSDMQQMGVNTIRLYNINPTNKVHKDFLDFAYSKGIYVIYPALTAWMSDPGNYNQAAVEKGIKEVCGNKDILAFTAGNEVTDFWANTRKAQIVRDAISLVRKDCPGALVTYAAEDAVSQWPVINGSSLYMKIVPDVDFITINAGYRGDGSNPSNTYPDLFRQVKQITNQYNKPFLIGEAGVYDTENNNYNPKWFNYVWKLILDNAKDSNIMGAVYFEYNDEPITKKGAPDSHMGVTVDATPTGDKSTFQTVPNIHKGLDYNGIGRGRHYYFANTAPKDDIDFCNYVYDCKRPTS